MSLRSTTGYSPARLPARVAELFKSGLDAWQDARNKMSKLQRVSLD